MAPAVRLALLALVACVALHAVSAAPAVEDDELDVFDDEPAAPPTPPAAAKPATKPAKAAKAATEAAAGATEDGAAKKDGKKDAKEPVLPPTPQYQVQRFCIATIIFQMIGFGCYMTNKYGDRVMKGGKTEIKKVYTGTFTVCLCLCLHAQLIAGVVVPRLMRICVNSASTIYTLVRHACFLFSKLPPCIQCMHILCTLL
jgi:hypothetical protein